MDHVHLREKVDAEVGRLGRRDSFVRLFKAAIEGCEGGSEVHLESRITPSFIICNMRSKHS